MTKLDERVAQAIDGETFEQRASVYIEEIDNYATAYYTVQVVYPQELADDLGITDKLNQLAKKYPDDDTALFDNVWDLVSDYLTSHPYNEPLLGIE